MQTKRLFIAAVPETNVLRNHLEAVKHDFEGALFGKWVEPHNLHLTLKFLGDTDVVLIPQIIASLQDLFGENFTPLAFAGLGAFPSVHSPRVLFASLSSGGDILIKLSKDINARLFEIGIPAEKKAFRPHFTLCRPKEFNFHNFSEAIEKYDKFNFGTSPGFSVVLFESQLTKSGPIYTKLQ